MNRKLLEDNTYPIIACCTQLSIKLLGSFASRIIIEILPLYRIIMVQQEDFFFFFSFLGWGGGGSN